MRTLKLFAVTLSTAALFCVAGCNAKPGSEVLAKVNGLPITADDLTFRKVEGHGKTPQYGPKTVEDIVDQELLYQKGIRLGLDQDPGYQRQLPELSRMPAGAKRLEMARRVFTTQIASRIEVRPDDGRKYYAAHADQIRTQLHLGLLKFDDRQKAEEALKKLRDGADFAGVAKGVMKGAGANGREAWDLGFVKWEQVPVEFADSLYRLKPGEVSAVLGSKATSFQIVKLMEKRTTPEPGYEKVSALVINRLRDLKLLEAYQQYLETLRKEATIVTF